MTDTYAPAAPSPFYTPPLAPQGAAPAPAPQPTPTHPIGPAGGLPYNNPLNLRQWAGVPSENGFARFGSIQDGWNAADQNLQAKLTKHGLTTVSAIIGTPGVGWAPASDGNDPATYSARVAADLGISPTTDISAQMRDPTFRHRMLESMAKVEIGRPLGFGTATAPASASAAAPDDTPPSLQDVLNAPAPGTSAPGAPQAQSDTPPSVQDVLDAGAPGQAGGVPAGDVYKGTTQPITPQQDKTIRDRIAAGQYDQSQPAGSDLYPYALSTDRPTAPPGTAYVDMEGVFHPATAESLPEEFAKGITEGATQNAAQIQAVASPNPLGALGAVLGPVTQPLVDLMHSALGPEPGPHVQQPNVSADMVNALVGASPLFQGSRITPPPQIANWLAVQPQTALGRIARAGGAGVSAAFIPGEEGLSIANVGRNALIGLGAGTTGQTAEEFSPESIRPAVGVGAGLLGALATHAGLSGLERSVGASVNALRPFTAAALPASAEAQAGQRLLSAASDPAALRAAVANGARETVPGSVPTTFQQSGDLGIGALERGARATNPAPFQEVAGQQNAARVQALQGIQQNADPAALGRSVTGMFDQLDREGQQAVDAARNGAQGAMQAIGGTTPPEAQGADLRAAIANAESTTRQREGALWQAIDPDGKLTGNVTATSQAARDIASSLPATAKPMGGEEAAIFDAAQHMSPISPVSDLIALRSRLSTAMREELIANGNSPAYARMSQLRGAIQNNLSSTISDAVAAGDRAVQSGELPAALSPRAQFERVLADAQTRGLQVSVGGSSLTPRQNAVGAAVAGGDSGAGSAPGAEPSAPSRGSLVSGVPTFDQAAADRLAQATAATRDRAQTFGLEPVESILEKAGSSTDFRMSDGSVPGRVFSTKPTAFTDMQAAIRAGGPDATAVLEDYAASTLRRDAGNPDGTIDPGRFAAWRARYDNAIRALSPETQARFADVGAASQALADATLARTQAQQAFRNSVLGRFIGVSDPNVVQRTVGAMFNRPTASQDIAALADAVRSNPDARDGLRQAVADHIATNLIGNTEVGTSGQAAIRADKFQTFVRQNGPALEHIFNPDEMDTMQRVADDIQQAQRSNNALRLTGGSDTEQNRNAVLKFLSQHPRGTRATVDMLAGLGALALGHGGSLPEALMALGGGSVADTLQRLHASGVANVNDLVTKALIDPNVARKLLARVPNDPKARTTLVRGLLQALQTGVWATAPRISNQAQPTPPAPRTVAVHALQGA